MYLGRGEAATGSLGCHNIRSKCFATLSNQWFQSARSRRHDSAGAQVRVLIVGAEASKRSTIHELLRRYDDIEVILEARSGREASAVIASRTPDALFIDAELPDMDAVDLVQRISIHRPPAIIFVAPSDAFALKAFDAQAIDYLVMPIAEERFDVTIARVTERLRRPAASASETVSSRQPTQHPLLLPGIGADVVVDVADIDWIEADDYCAALYVSGKRRLIRKPMHELEQVLDGLAFVRVHRSAIVNLARVRELRHTSAGARVVLADGTAIPLSRRRRKQVTAALRHFASDRARKGR